jgi:ribonucleoside-diphosphate reductase alpha chain
MIDNKILEYFNNDELAASVWCNKYRYNNESIEEFFNRITSNFNRLLYSRIERYNGLVPNECSDFGKEFWHGYNSTYIYSAIQNGDIIPAGSVLSGLGTDNPISLSNCFFNGAMKDDINSIWDTTKSMAQVGKRRGGTSTDISHLRPRGSKINNSSKVSSGAVEFLNLIDTTGKMIGQSGRKMAIMVTMDINHPDIEEFITIKNDLSKITNANLSIKLNNKFVKAVEEDKDYLLTYPCDITSAEGYGEDLPYGELFSFIGENNEKFYGKKVRAKELWKKIINSAHQYAEPGLLNWDRVLEYDPTSVYEELKPRGTNPCSELPLGDLDSCRLICINLYNFVNNPFKESSVLDYNKIYKTAYIAQVIGDILVDLEIEAIDRILEKIYPQYRSLLSDNGEWQGEINSMSEEFQLWWKIRCIGLAGRRTGIETTGYADMLAALGKEYGDNIITTRVYKTMMQAELDATVDMAILFGSFPLYDQDKEWEISGDPTNGYIIGAQNKFFEFINNEFPKIAYKMCKYGRRNSGWSTIGPCGSISLITKPNTKYNFPGLSSGIEPVFSLWYTRRRKSNSEEIPTFIDPNGVGYIEYRIIHPRFKEYIYITQGDQNLQIPKLGILGSELVPPEEWPEKVLLECSKLSPFWNQTADKIDYKTRVETQALIQNYITSSISSTVNLSKDVSQEIVSNIYLEAFNQGCKGITVYRENSRSGILIKEEKKENTIRPKILDCNVLNFKNEKKDWIAFVGILNGNPYELFTGPRDMDVFPVPSAITNGKIIRVKPNSEERSRYDFSYTDSYGYENRLGGLSRVFSQEYYNYGRFVSALLRGNYKIDEIIRIVNGMDFGTKSLNNWKSGVIRALKGYIPDGTEIKGEVCEECGGKMVYENGCSLCVGCGHSKCL